MPALSKPSLFFEVQTSPLPAFSFFRECIVLLGSNPQTPNKIRRNIGQCKLPQQANFFSFFLFFLAFIFSVWFWWLPSHERKSLMGWHELQGCIVGELHKCEGLKGWYSKKENPLIWVWMWIDDAIHGFPLFDYWYTSTINLVI